MMQQQGTVNGFRFSFGLAGQPNKWRKADMAVIPLPNGEYVCLEISKAWKTGLDPAKDGLTVYLQFA